VKPDIKHTVMNEKKERYLLIAVATGDEEAVFPLSIFSKLLSEIAYVFLTSKFLPYTTRLWK
jgi:hypothetical protein